LKLCDYLPPTIRHTLASRFESDGFHDGWRGRAETSQATAAAENNKHPRRAGATT
jgi:hypothetical protein